MRIYTKLPTPSTAPVSNGTVTFQIPLGLRFHDVVLRLFSTAVKTAANFLAAVTEIRIILNGQIMQRFTAGERDIFNQFDGLAAAASIAADGGHETFLRIPFDRQRLLSFAAEIETAINTGSADPANNAAIKTFSIECDLGDVSTFTAFLAELKATQSDSQPNGPGTVIQLRKFPQSFAGAGVFEKHDLPHGDLSTQILNRLYIQDPTSQILEVEILSDQRTVWRRLTSENNDILTKLGVRVPQANLFVVDFTETGYGGLMLPLVGISDLNVRVTLAGAANLVFIPEYMGKLNP